MSRLGSLIVRLALENLAGYKGELDQAATATEKSGQRIEQAGRKAADGLERMKDATDGNVGAAVDLAAAAGPAATGLLAVAAGAAVATSAYIQGAREGQAFEKSLILTGNAAGTTSSQMQAMAAQISAAKGTHAAAAAALAEIASTGMVAGQNLELLGEAAVRSEKVLGTAVSDMAKTFAKLGDAPVSASLELNKSINYLTASTFAQIKAADDLGDRSTAASLAQKAYADSSIDAANRVEANLGTLEKAWKAAGDMAGWAWDKFMGIGRADGAVQQLARANTAVGNLETLIAKGGTAVPELERKLALAIANRNAVQQTVDAEAQAATAQAVNAQAQRNGIEAMQAVDAMNTKALTKTQQLEKALKGYRDQLQAIKAVSPDDARLAPAQVKATEDYLRKQYAESAGRTVQPVSESAKGLALYNDLMDQSAGFTKQWAEEVNRLTAAYKSGAIPTYEEYSAAVQVLLAKQPVMVKLAKDAKEATDADAKALAEATKERARHNQELERAADGMEAQVQKLQDEEKGLQLAAAQNITLASAIAQVEVARLREAQAIQMSYGDDVAAAAIQREIDARLKLATLMDSKEVREASKRGAEDAVKAWQKAGEKISDTITDALMRGFENGKGLIANLRDTFANVMQTALVRPGVQGLVNVGSNFLGLGGGGRSVDMLSGLMNLGGTFGSSMASGFSLAMNGGTGMAMEGGWAMLTGATGSSSALAGLGQLAGAAAPWVAGALLLNEAISGLNGGKEYTTGSGISGTFSGSGFSGSNYQDWKNDGDKFFGMSVGRSSSGTNYSAMDAGQMQALSQGFMAVKASSLGYASALGLSAESIKSYSKSIKLELGADAEANSKAIAATFEGIANDIASTLVSAEYLRSGEASSATLARLATSLTTVNSWMSVLRQRLLSVSLAGGDAASQLADAFGGLDKFTQGSKTFFELYYTQGEQVAASQKAMTDSLAALGFALPDNKQGLRDLAASLDLNTVSGRAAYATLIALAPEFARTSDQMAALAKEAATALLKTFTGNGQLVPALDAAALSVAGATHGTTTLTGAVSYMHSVMLDTSSPVLTFGSDVQVLSTELTGAQISAQALRDQMVALSGSTSKSVIDFVGLRDALATVDTAGFVETLMQVFDNLGERISGVIDSIGSERVAVREAALSIIDPMVMSRQSIAAGVAAVNVSLPSSSGLQSATAALGAANAAQTAATTAVATSTGAASAALKAKADLVSFYAGKNAELRALAAAYTPSGTSLTFDTASLLDNAAYNYNASTNQLNPFNWLGYTSRTDTLSAWYGSASTTYTPDYEGMRANPKYRELTGVLDGGNGALAAAAQKIIDTQAAAVAAQARAASATTAQQQAVQVAAKATLDYQKALQDFAIDASKSITKLGNLRAETVKYYEAQKALADLMGSSAAGLRTTVANYRYSQLSAADQVASLQAQFASAYSMAQATQGDGATLVTYADKLNGTLAPLLEKLAETGKGNLIASYLAQAETVAQLLEANAPKNYQAESLGLLGQIDGTLAALDASTQSAERLITEAVKAGSDRTAAGLYAVVRALGGVPAFASGGYHSGGARWVGENGPELEVTGPSQIFNASQLHSMRSTGSAGGAGGGNTLRLEALIERQNQLLEQQNRQIEGLRAEARATAVSSGKTANILRRVTQDGDTLLTETAA